MVSSFEALATNCQHLPWLKALLSLMQRRRLFLGDAGFKLIRDYEPPAQAAHQR